jgi:hypothetical protein
MLVDGDVDFEEIILGVLIRPAGEPQGIFEFGRHRIADIRIGLEEFFYVVSALAYALPVI